MTAKTGSRPRVGFVATRIIGTDGVSLEIKKWQDILEGMGFDCYFIAGASDRAAAKSFIIKEAHLEHEAVKEIDREAFSSEKRSPKLVPKINEVCYVILEQLRQAISQFKLDVIIVENAFTIPMNIPLGLALLFYLQEENICCIAHHHDFYWERERYLINCVDDFLLAAFPPQLSQIQHVVINSQAANQFSRRTGLSARVIPNVMNFDVPPPEPDDYAKSFKREIGLADDDLLILQPTRVVARKGIEHAIEIVKRLENHKAKLVITHSSLDEGTTYAEYIRQFARLLDVNVLFVDDQIGLERGTTADGKKVFTIEDAYSQADLVTYPSRLEGFGNAFLEAIYFRKPVVCNRYAIYRTDIEPFGFEPLLFDGFVTDDIINDIHRVLNDADFRRRMVERNYQVAQKYFSYRIVENELWSIFRQPLFTCGMAR